MSYPELWQFRFSMYPEKARWALDYKGVPHRRRSVLPGPHAAQLFPRFGQKAMPILCHEGNVLKSSAAVLDYIEQVFPNPPLYPADVVQRERSLEIQQWFDEEIGPPLRRAAFYEWLGETEYSARRFAYGLPEWQQRCYVRAFPAIRAIMRADMRIGRAGAEKGCALVAQGLDFVARESAATGYLIGDRFSIADLAAATILMGTCLPPEFPVPMPEPRPPGWQHWLDRWKDHPGCAYVLRMYREHRGQSCAVAE
jgi:glutathione S-transferase